MIIVQLFYYSAANIRTCVSLDLTLWTKQQRWTLQHWHTLMTGDPAGWSNNSTGWANSWSSMHPHKSDKWFKLWMWRARTAAREKCVRCCCSLETGWSAELMCPHLRCGKLVSLFAVQWQHKTWSFFPLYRTSEEPLCPDWSRKSSQKCRTKSTRITMSSVVSSFNSSSFTAPFYFLFLQIFFTDKSCFSNFSVIYCEDCMYICQSHCFQNVSSYIEYAAISVGHLNDSDAAEENMFTWDFSGSSASLSVCQSRGSVGVLTWFFSA